MTLYPIVKQINEYDAIPHLSVMVNGSRTALPVGTGAKAGDYIAVVNYDEMMTLLRRGVPLEIQEMDKGLICT